MHPVYPAYGYRTIFMVAEVILQIQQSIIFSTVIQPVHFEKMEPPQFQPKIESPFFKKWYHMIKERSIEDVSQNIFLNRHRCNAIFLEKKLSPLRRECLVCSTKKHLQWYCNSAHENVFNADQSQIWMHDIWNVLTLCYNITPYTVAR